MHIPAASWYDSGCAFTEYILCTLGVQYRLEYYANVFWVFIIAISIYYHAHHITLAGLAFTSMFINRIQPHTHTHPRCSGLGLWTYSKPPKTQIFKCILLARKCVVHNKTFYILYNFGKIIIKQHWSGRKNCGACKLARIWKVWNDHNFFYYSPGLSDFCRDHNHKKGMPPNRII